MAQKEPKFVLPINLLTEGRKAVVIGGGRIAYRKARSLTLAGLRVTVVSRSFASLDWDHIGIEKIEADYQSLHLDSAALVIAATDNAILNLRILDDARRIGALCNLVDSGWSEGDFITPAVVRAGEVTLGITTGGTDCRKSKRIKDQLLDRVETLIDTKSFSFVTSFHSKHAVELLLRRLNGVVEYLIHDCGDVIRVEGIGSLTKDDLELFHLITGGIDEICN